MSQLSKHETSEFPAAVPEIPVSDLQAALAYYTASLGFNVDWVEKMGLAGISRGACRIFVADKNFRERYRNTGPALVWLNLDSKEKVDALHKQWAADNARIISPAESKPWGLHEFTAADTDGNLFRVFYDFGTPERDKDSG